MAATDGRQLLRPYDQLLLHAPSPVVALNRAVAVAEVEGPDAARAYEAAAARTENAIEREFLRRRRHALHPARRAHPGVPPPLPI